MNQGEVQTSSRGGDAPEMTLRAVALSIVLAVLMYRMATRQKLDLHEV